MSLLSILEELRHSQPRLGPSWLLSIDGPSGGGKTTLANELADRPEVVIVELETFYRGWDGLEQGLVVAHQVLTEFSRSRNATYRPYDWHRDKLAAPVTLQLQPVVVVEGVGAGNQAWAPWINTLIWVDADVNTRQRRAFARGHQHIEHHWPRWTEAEKLHFRKNRTHRRADWILTTAESADIAQAAWERRSRPAPRCRHE